MAKLSLKVLLGVFALMSHTSAGLCADSEDVKILKEGKLISSHVVEYEVDRTLQDIKHTVIYKDKVYLCTVRLASGHFDTFYCTEPLRLTD